MLFNSYRFESAFDADAVVYLNAVEKADNASLEAGVWIAVNAFVVGCKSDGIRAAIKASCILAGARTLAGALVPLAGTAPTNNNFVSGDYNRKTGLVGDGSSKNLQTGRLNNQDPRNDSHFSVYCSSRPTTGSYPTLISTGGYGSDGYSFIYLNRSSTPNGWQFGNRENTGSVGTTNNTEPNFLATNRSSSSQYSYRYSGANYLFSSNSYAPGSSEWLVFSTNGGNYANARIAFYSIGTSLDVAKLDSRVTTLLNALAAAIP